MCSTGSTHTSAPPSRPALPHDPELAALVSELESALARRITQPAAARAARRASREDRSPDRPAVRQRRTVRLPGPFRCGRRSRAGESLRSSRSSRRNDRPPEPAAGHRRRQPPLRDHCRARLSPEHACRAADAAAPQNADARFIQLASLAQQFWEKPDDLPVKLAAAGESGRGYALFDPASNQGFIAIRQLPVIEQGKRYHLWLLDTVSGQVREAGILPVTDPDPRALLLLRRAGRGCKTREPELLCDRRGRFRARFEPSPGQGGPGRQENLKRLLLLGAWPNGGRAA